MTLTEALTQLRAWCDQSRGAVIEIAPGVTGSFQSRATFGEASVREIEAELGVELPPAYYEFMAAVGESSLFGWSPHGGGPYFYHPRQAIETSQEWAAARPEVERFCFVGEHRSMGDMMGFCLARPAPANFDVYCHEYPFEEYTAVSDELRSWREFGPYLLRVIESHGRDSLQRLAALQMPNPALHLTGAAKPAPAGELGRSAAEALKSLSTASEELEVRVTNFDGQRHRTTAPATAELGRSALTFSENIYVEHRNKAILGTVFHARPS